MTASALVVESPPRPESMLSLFESVHHVVKASLNRIQPTLSEEGVTMGQFWSLHTVSSLESASLNTVARYLGVSAPTLCASLDQLEAAGLVRRARTAKDRRSVALTLTPRGRKVESRVWEEMARVMSSATEGLPASDLAATQRVFRALAQRLKERPAVARRSA
jgi:MarR family transcriptional regulator, organic hydroperoxide resistance regulator